MSAIAPATGRKLAEVAFLLIVIAGVWLVAAEIPALRARRARTIVVGTALQRPACCSSLPPIGAISASALTTNLGARLPLEPAGRATGPMATPVKVRRLSDDEGRQLQRIVRRGGGKSDKSIVKWRRALVVLASAGGNDVAAIARLVQTSPDRVREMIHSFNDKGMGALDPQWAGGRPRRITTEERQLIIKTATKRPRSPRSALHPLERPQAGALPGGQEGAPGVVSRAAPPDPRRGDDHLPAHQDLEGVTRSAPRGEAGPHRVPPRRRAGAHVRLRRVRTTRRQARGWVVLGADVEATAPAGQLPQAARDQAALRLVLGGCDRLYGRIEPKKGARPTLRALKAIRASVPDGEMISVILENLNHHRGSMIRAWCVENAVELAFTPTYGSWANPIEAHFGRCESSPSPTRTTRAMPKWPRPSELIRWRNAHTTDPEILALERKHRATLRGEAQRRRGETQSPRRIARADHCYLQCHLAERRIHTPCSDSGAAISVIRPPRCSWIALDACRYPGSSACSLPVARGTFVVTALAVRSRPPRLPPG